jgi:hypothetical protein
MTIKPLPTSYLMSCLPVTWRDALWGVEQGWATRDVLIERAIQQVLDGSDDATIIALAGLFKHEQNAALDLARILAAKEIESPADPSSTWLCLALRWAFENRNLFADPLALVEELYADFDYPAEIASFVRYMPSDPGYNPAEHTSIENEARLYRDWGRYVEENCK